ncbi:MAG: TIGR03943 family protein [Pseudolysinimonas sp.]|uniref:TIGR03943 family putative permease subunit n=1 Tax=Pseudolysinimonas sp. TaxID=2680009 RepID=UPI0032635C7D
MSERFTKRWLGVTLSLIGVVAILWLGATGRLELYIHPRYVVFTAIMAVIGGAASIAAFLVVPLAGHDHDDDDDGDPRPVRRGGVLLRVSGSAVLVIAAVVALLVLPPATLSSATAANRDISSSSSLDSADSTHLVGGDSTSFTVKDWATLLHQGLGDDFFAGKPAHISGFLVATDDPDVVYVARFLVTCCAVDAQPLGVPVYLPDWQQNFAADDWVDVTGTFGVNPDAGAALTVVLTAAKTDKIPVPAQPYVY